MKKTAIILSGGMDSTAITWWKRPDIAFTVDYGQRAAAAEIDASSQLCEALKIPHYVIKVDCSSLGSGDLSNKNPISNAPASDWWPFRNQLLITLVAMKAISYDVDKLIIGTVKGDNIHKDGSIEFINEISHLLNLQEGMISVLAPAIDLSTTELIKTSKIPNEYLFWSHSCHKENIPCNNCRGCNKHNQVLIDLGLF
ncbi:7-cyano-7-deazaguanine synthase [Pectobacterium carotovorum]|uniref:7-cyano-7-deazaguanine synthase n=1 Tax=Pectobacterium brasiliense TaxID=180957 RepID=UPI000B974565|nr:7-cyano-7-deazaguanine synthase [Pectobacterium carotovorum]OYN52767.1 7-cyano-7-deazaguanine synthase [Pectobacterium carotovorum]